MTESKHRKNLVWSITVEFERFERGPLIVVILVDLIAKSGEPPTSKTTITSEFYRHSKANCK